MAEASFPTSCRGSPRPALQVSSNINHDALHQLHIRTRPWATAVSSAGQPAATDHRLPLAALPLPPAEPHSHRLLPLRRHGRPPRAGGAPREQRKPVDEHQRHPAGHRSADCSSCKDRCRCGPLSRRWRALLTIAPSDPHTAPLTLAKLQDPFKKSLESAQKDLKPIYSGLNKYGKVLDKACSLIALQVPS
jgi:hypothetical protein